MDKSDVSYWTKRRRICAAVSQHLTNIETSSVDVDHTKLPNHYVDNADTALCSVESCSTPHVEQQQLLFDSNDNLCSDENNWQSDSYLGDEYDSDDAVNDDFSSGECFDSDSGLGEQWANWAVQYGITLRSLTRLLKILHVQHPLLPKDGRTLLGTKYQYNVVEVAGGYYYNFGIGPSIENLLKTNPALAGVNPVKLQINIDGLPLYKSSNVQFWPILGMLADVHEQEPFTIGIFCGNRKPGNLSEFLKPFVDESKLLLQDGICVCNGSHVSFEIQYIICDAPARAFVKCTKPHTAYNSCERCIQEGKWKNNRMTLPDVDVELRTNVKFDVKRKLLLLWLKGPLVCRLPAEVVKCVSAALVNMKSFVPNDFARKPRPLSEVDRFKATEFRLMLLYTGVVALRNKLNDVFYYNFLLLSVAMHILLSPRYCTHYCDYARQLLCLFVTNFSELYGDHFVVYNVNSLIHLADDASRFGPLDNVSCFPFENYLQSIKKLIRKPAFPLQQVICRLYKRTQYSHSSDNHTEETSLNLTCSNSHLRCILIR